MNKQRKSPSSSSSLLYTFEIENFEPFGLMFVNTFNDCFLIILIFLFLSPGSSGGYSYTTKAFIFSLRNKEGLSPFKSMVKIPRYAIFRRSNYGPTFGGGHNIRIYDHANSNTHSYTNFGYYYSVPDGVKDRRTILAGTYRFTLDDWEVFYLT